jgi:hypothetical protein
MQLKLEFKDLDLNSRIPDIYIEADYTTPFELVQKRIKDKLKQLDVPLCTFNDIEKGNFYLCFKGIKLDYEEGMPAISNAHKEVIKQKKILESIKEKLAGLKEIVVDYDALPDDIKNSLPHKQPEH